MEITTKIKISDQFIDDVISTAFEGGINYWCEKAEPADEKSRNLHEESNYLSSIVSKGGSILLYMDDGDSQILTLAKLKRGLQIGFEKGYFETDIENTYDADTADMIIQFAVFGDLVYS